MATEPVLIIPLSQLGHILSKPEIESNAHGPQIELVQMPYTVGDKEIYHNNFRFGVNGKELAKNLPLLMEDFAEVLAFAFEKCGAHRHNEAPSSSGSLF